MKKIVLSILVLVLSTLCANAQITYKCVEEPYPVANKVSGFLNTVSGANFLSKKAVEKVITSNLKKNTGGTFEVTMTPFNATDLVAGKFQSLSFSTSEVNMGGVFVHDFVGKTACGYNRIGFELDKTPKIYEDFLVDFSAKITNSDLQKTLMCEDFKKYLSGLSLNIGSFQMLKVDKPKLSIVNNKLRYAFRINAPVLFSEFSQELVCDMDLNIRNGKLTFSDIKINNTSALPPELVNKILRRINPFKIDLEKSLGIPAFIDLKNVAIVNNEIAISGTFVAPRNYESED